MAKFNLPRWLQTLVGATPKTIQKPRRRRQLRMEQLEDRITPASLVWDGSASSLWSNPQNWNGNPGNTLFPTNGDDLVFPAGAANIVNTNDIDNLALNSIAISGTGFALGGVPITLGSGASGTGFINVNGAGITDAISFDITLGGAAGDKQFFTVNSNTTVLTISGKLSGTTGVELSKDGQGTLVLAGDNKDFTGAISITEGAVNIRNANALGDALAPTTVVFDTNTGKFGQLQVQNVSGPIKEQLFLNGTGPLNDGALLNVASVNTWTGNIELDSDSTMGANAGALIIQGVISDLGAGHNLSKEGPAKVVLDPLGTAAGNTYRGQTFVNAGTLTIRHSLALGNDPTPIQGINDTVVQSSTNRSGTLELEFVTNPLRIDPNATPTGFKVPTESLTLNGPGREGIHVLPKDHLVNGGITVSGALNNLAGNNTWVQDISLWSANSSILFNFRTWNWATVGMGAEAGTELTIAGIVRDNFITGTPSLPTIDYSLIKTHAGRVILINENTYRGRTEVLEGYLNIRDSAALGRGGFARNETIVFQQGTLELEADAIPDSAAPHPNAPDGTPHLPTDIVITGIGENFSIMGTGAGGDGAIRNIRGTNENSGILPILTAIGRGETPVAPLPPATPRIKIPPPFGRPEYYGVTFTDTGASVGVQPDQAPFTQFDLSQLTLSGVIQNGLVPVGIPGGPNELTKVGTGELVLTDSVNSYTGSTFIREGWITARQNRSLGGDFLNFPDTFQPPTYVATGAALHLKQDRAGLPIAVTERIFLSGIGFDHRYPELKFRGALENLSNENALTGIVNLVAVPGFTQIGIGADVANSPWVPADLNVTKSNLSLTHLMQETSPDTNLANFPPGSVPAPQPLIPAGVNKLGRKRASLQGYGTYTGDNLVTEGTLRVQNDIALGMLSGTTTVLAGAAIETKGYALSARLNNGLAQWANSVIDFSSQFSTTSWAASQATGAPDTFTYGDIPTAWSALNQNGPPNPEFITLGYATAVFATGVTVRETFNNGFVFQIDVLDTLNVYHTVWTGTDPSPDLTPEDFVIDFPETPYLVKGVKVYVNPNQGASWEEIDAVQLRGITPVILVDNTLNGGLPGGVQIRENLILNGLGSVTTDHPFHDYNFNINPAFRVDTLTNVANDNMWRSPITFATDVTISSKPHSRLSLWKTIDGPGGFEKDDQGKLILGGVNSYAGLTRLNAGTLNLQSSSALGGSAGGTIVANNAQIELQGDVTIAGESLTVLGNGPDVAPVIPLRWFPEGPGPISVTEWSGDSATGRVTGVVVDPFDTNVLYLSAAGGGAWRSINNGFTWQPLIDNVPGLTIDQIMFTGAIAVAPLDSNTIYVGLGETNNSGDSYYGRGVLKSSDFGRSWSLIQPPGNAFDRHTISRIVVDPREADTIYVTVEGSGVNEGDEGPFFPGNPANYGLWRLRNGTWVNMTAGVITPIVFSSVIHHFTDLQVFDANPRITVNDPRHPNQPLRRIIAFALGNYTGGGTGSVANAVYTSIDADLNNPAPVWTTGFPSGLETVAGFLNQPRNGMIKLDGVRNANSKDTIVLYAAITYPVSFPRFLAGQDGEFREIQTATVTYDPNTGLWTANGWGAVGVQPGADYQGDNGGQGWYDSTIAVQSQTLASPAYNTRLGNPNFVFVGGIGSIFTSGPWVYNGAAWNDVDPGTDGKGPHVDYHASFFDRNGILVVGNDGGIWRMENTTPPGAGAAVWTNKNGNFLQITQFNGLDVHPFNPFFAIGGSQDNSTHVYDDSFTHQAVEGGDGGIVRINNKNPNIVFHVLNGELRRSTTGGGAGSWQTVFPPPAIPPAGLYFPFILDRVNPARVILGHGSDLWESNADGAFGTFNIIGAATSNPNGLTGITSMAVSDRQGLWQNDPNFPLVLDQGADSYDADTIYVATTSGVYVTKNHGQAWVRRNTGLTTNDLIDITVDPRNRDVAYVVRNVFNSAGGERVFKTSNGGRDWVDISGNLPDLPTWKVVVNPRNGDVFIGNDNGVYLLPKGNGTTWERFGQGMPNVQIKELVLNTYTNMLSAGTYGRGVYQVWLDDSLANSGAVRSVTGSSLWTGNVTVVGALDIRTEINSSVQFAGVIADGAGGPFTINKLGAGRAVFSGANTYAGLTDVKEGTLNVRNTNALGSSASPTGDTIVRAGAALEMQADLFREKVILNGDGIQINGHDTGALRNISNNNTFTGTLVLNTNSTIGVDSGSQLTIGQKISGGAVVPSAGTGLIDDGAAARKLTKELTGTLVLNAGNTYDGVTEVIQGILRAEHATALGSAAGGTQVDNGAQLQLNKDTSGAGITIAGENLILSGSGIFGTGALENFGGNNTWQGPVNLTAKQGKAAPLPPLPPAIINIGVLNAADMLTIDGAITETAVTIPAQPPLIPAPVTISSFGLTKVLPGKLVFKGSTANTYTGLTTVQTGVLNVQKAQALGTTAAGTVVKNGAALETEGNVVYVAETVTLNGKGVSPANLGALRNVAGANNWTGPVILNSTVAAASATPNPQINIGADAGSSLAISGNVQDPAGVPASLKAAELHKVGDGTIIFPNANTYQGLTVIDKGALNIRNDGSLGAAGVAANGTIVNSGGTLQTEGGFTETDETLTLFGAGQNGQGALANNAGANNWNNLITLGDNNVALGSNAGTLTINGQITDAANVFGVTKVGPATVEFAGGTDNEIQGLTKVNEGTLLLNKTTDTFNFDGNLTIGDGVPASPAADSAILLLGASDQIPNAALTTINADGLLDLNGFAETINTLALNNGHAQTDAGVLTVANTLTMTGGDIQLNGAGDQLLFGAGASINATSSAAETPVIRGAGFLALAGADPRTFNVSDGPRISDLQITAPISGALGERLIKDGAGLMEIDSNANTYTGVTEAHAGILQVDGTIGAVELNGGTLGGTGTTGTVTALPAGGKVNPGDSPGILHAGATVWNSATTFFVELNRLNPTPSVLNAGLDYDQLQVNGNINLGNAHLDGLVDAIGLGVVTADPPTTVGDSFTIIQTTGGNVIGKFAENDHVFVFGKKFNITYNATSVVLTKVKSDVTINIASSANPAVWGQPVAFTITATPQAGADPIPPTATVDIHLVGPNEDVTVSKTLVNGQFSFNPVTLFGVNLEVGLHQLKIKFHDPTKNFQDFPLVPEMTLNQTVNKADSTISLVSSSPGNTSVYGDNTVKITAKLGIVPPGGSESGTSVISGTVTFKRDGVVQGAPAAVFFNGTQYVAQISVPANLPVSDYAYSAAYSGDVHFNTVATTQDLVQHVIKANTAVGIVGNPSPSDIGQNVTFTVTVSAVNPSTSTPTGTVVIKDGATTFGSGAVDNSGQIQFTINSLTFGAHTINADYQGDTNFNISSAVPGLPHVVRGETQTIIVSNINPSTHGQSVIFGVTVSSVAPASGIPGGSVDFLDNGVLIPGGDDVALTGGAVAFATNLLAAGTHTITANYNGAPTFKPSVGTVTPNQVVTKANTSTTLSALPVGAPAGTTVFGEALTFTATIGILSPGGGTIAGTVDFLDNGVLIPGGANVALVGNQASLTTMLVAAGAHPNITAKYNGTVNYNISTSAPLNRTVNKANTQTALATDVPIAIYGQATIKATVTALAPGGNIPAGDVTFFITNTLTSTTTQRTSNLDAAGVATLTPPLDVGMYSILAKYNGNSNYNASANSNTINQTVTQAATLTVLATSDNDAVYGEPIITAAVAAQAPGVGIPTGLVIFHVNNGTSITDYPVSLDVNGVATLPQLDAGNYTINADYNGSVNFMSSVGAPPLTQAIHPANSSVGVQSNHNPSRFGQAVTFTAAVSAVSPGFGIPPGSVHFIIDAADMTPGGVALVNGQATFTISNLAVAGSPHAVVVNYGGSNNFIFSSGSLVGGQTVQKGDTGTIVSSSANPSALGALVTFTATVSAVAPALGIPSGLVRFFIDGVQQAPDAPLNGSAQAAIAATFAAQGNHTVQAFYQSDGNFNLSNGSLTQDVKANSTTTVTSNANPSTFGQTVTITATITPIVPLLPSGTVDFIIDGVTVASNVAMSGNTATFQTSTLTVSGSPHVASAHYDGDVNWFPSDGTLAGGQTVNKAATGTGVVSNTATVFGQTATFTATVTNTVTGATPVGSVTFVDQFDNSNLGTMNVSGSGTTATASVSTTSLVVASHTVVATFNPSNDFLGSNGNTVHVVNAANTTTTVVSSLNPSFFEQVVTFTATVLPVAPGAGTATGFVRFFVDGTAQAPDQPLAGTHASFSTNALAIGTHTVTAQYLGSASFNGSIGNVNPDQKVNLNPVAFIMTPGSVVSGKSFTVIVHYRNAAGTGPDPSFNGPVSIAINTGPAGGTLGGTATVNAVNGVATFNLTLYRAGSYTFRASANNLPAVISNNIEVTANSLAASTSPAKIFTNSPFAINVVALDATGNVAGNYSGPFTLTVVKAPALGKVTGPKTGTFSGGFGQLIGLTVNKAGVYTLRINGPFGLSRTFQITIRARRSS